VGSRTRGEVLGAPHHLQRSAQGPVASHSSAETNPFSTQSIASDFFNALKASTSRPKICIQDSNGFSCAQS
jgi:hypothetical protein